MKRPVVERRPLGRKPDLETLVQRAVDVVRSESVTDSAQAVLEQIASFPEAIRTQVKWDVRRALNEDLGVRQSSPANRPRAASPRALADAVFAKAAS